MCISKFKTTLNPDFTYPVTFLSLTLRIVLSVIQEQMTLQDAIPLDFMYEKLFGTQGQEEILG